MRLAPRIVRAVAASAASLCLVAALSAQTPVKPASTLDVRRPAGLRTPRPGGASRAAISAATSVHGSAWHANNTPVPNAPLRLRDVVTGKILATTVASDTGNFAFTGIADGTYLVEMISDSGKVLAVSHTFTVAPGETVATFVRLAAKVPWFKGLFENAARTVSVGAAAAGVTAIAPSRATPISASR